MGAMLIAFVFSFIFYFVDPDSVATIFSLNMIMGLASGIVLPLIWSMYADIADYSEWKTGRRATGLVFSSSSMSQKMGWTLGGAITGWLLAAYGFEANAEQSEESLKGIRLMISIYPAVGALLSTLLLLLYKLSDRFMEQITSDLETRRDVRENT
jgi:GPH family glycoside/pentoside/hexuronide:cation symporter